MDKNIKATTLGSLHQDLFFNKKVSISFDTLEYDNTAEYKVLVQIEPPSIREDIINNLLNYNNNFDLILTWHPQILSKCKNSILFPFGSCWINKEDRKIHSKIKKLSIISSYKKITKGHKLRHSLIESKLINMDVFGRGYRPIENKITALKDYRFSLIIENESSNNWFTEKLIDCLVTGTVPVFWGCPNIHEFFDTRGFILFNNINQIPGIEAECNEIVYKNLLPFIKKNYYSALEYINFFNRIKKTIENEL